MLGLGCAAPAPAWEPRARHQLVVVLDGLRPDFVTAAAMPNLHALARAGAVATRHHAVVPTLSGVNAVSLVTGAYPQTHGILGHDMYLPEIDADRTVDVGRLEQLQALRAAPGGSAVTAPSLARILADAGRKLAVVTFWHIGTLPALCQLEGAGAAINPFRSWPPEVHERARAAVGEVRADTTRAQLIDWVVDATLLVALDALKADTTILWISEPDHTAHAHGVGAPETMAAAREVDAALGRLLAELERRKLRDQTNVFVCSDHGLTTIAGGRALADLVAAGDGRSEDDGEGGTELFVTVPAVYERSADPDRLRRLVEHLQSDAEVGPVFTRPVEPGSPLGVVPGTLSYELIRWNHPRAGALLMSGAWTQAPSPWGYPGTVVADPVVRAGHASTSPYDIHATLIAAGPDIARGVRSEVPTAIVDLAPTLLRLQRVALPASMDGRVLEELLRGGPPPASIHVDHETFAADAPSRVGRYRITAKTARVGRHRYFEQADVER